METKNTKVSQDAENLVNLWRYHVERKRLIDVEVDEAVKAQGKDPTGGRVNGSISKQLDAKDAEDKLESAV